MKMGFWRTVLLVVLGILGLAMAMRFLGRAIALALAAIPLLLVVYVIRRLWRGGRRCNDEVETPESAFNRRHPRLARLERRIKSLDPNVDL